MRKRTREKWEQPSDKKTCCDTEDSTSATCKER